MSSHQGVFIKEEVQVIDTVFTLTGTDLCDTLEHILSYLDGLSLSRAELVCRRWNEAIVYRRLWRKTPDVIWTAIQQRHAHRHDIHVRTHRSCSSSWARQHDREAQLDDCCSLA